MSAARPASALALLFAACRPTAAPAPPTSPVPSAEVVAPPAPALVPRPAAAPVAGSRLQDARWLSARDPDPLEKRKLAAGVGAAELLAGVEDGGETGDTALAALPYADDAEIALARLGEIARSDATRRRRVLVAILGVAGQPRRARDPLDAEGARRCGDVMLGMAADTTLSREDRALALSAARALAELGYVDASRISLERGYGGLPHR